MKLYILPLIALLYIGGIMDATSTPEVSIEDFEMPEDLSYFTSFEMGPTKEQKSKLHYYGCNLWEGPIHL